MKKEETWKTLISLLKVIAKERDISQYQISERTGIKQPSVNQILNLRKCPRIDTVIKIADAIDMNISVKTRGEEKLNFDRLLIEARKNYR
jgi:DNA-binding phage protein